MIHISFCSIIAMEMSSLSHRGVLKRAKDLQRPCAASLPPDRRSLETRVSFTPLHINVTLSCSSASRAAPLDPRRDKSHSTTALALQFTGQVYSHSFHFYLRLNENTFVRRYIKRINNRTFLERCIFVPSERCVFYFACAVRRARSTGSIITMLRYTHNIFLWCSIFKCAIKAIVIYNLLLMNI